MENIQYPTETYTDAQILEHLHPFVREWFTSTFPSFTPPQRYAIRTIQERKNTLIASPTGSGKTLSAFLAIINELVLRADTGRLTDSVVCVYLSPLKALANDITRNLTEPLAQISKIAEKYGRTLDIRVGTRTGDTSANERRKMADRPPHLLITTPESLAILLTTEKFVHSLASVQYVIVDEIHALAENKRGTHMSLSLERLARIAQYTRIGLSATVAPLEDVAHFLVGMEDPERGTYRPCTIIDINKLKNPDGTTFHKTLDLAVLSPVADLINTTHHHMQEAMYGKIHELIQEHRTTLIFTNTRSATERVVHQLRERFPQHYASILDADDEQEKVEDEEGQTHEHLASMIGAHHGSLSKEHRMRIEGLLKEGKLRSVVCSTSLELGIDIGYIDLVILLGSPKSIARALQRIGRSGHKLTAHPKGRIIVMDRDDLVECAVLVKAALAGTMDQLTIPRNALDVLAQQLYGMAIEQPTHIEDAWRLVRSAFAYNELSRGDFEATLQYLAGGSERLEQRHIYAKIWIDEATKTFGKKGKTARVIYMTNVGTIPDEAAVRVKIGETTIGTVTEDFSERLRPGDVFVLGGEPYEFKFSRGMTMQVATSGGRLPTVPSWISEMLPLSFDLALQIAQTRRNIAQHLENKMRDAELRAWIGTHLPVDAIAAQAIAQYFTEQHRFSIIPHRTRILLEHFKDGNKKYVFVHTLIGRRANDVLARACAFANARITGRDVEIGITDNGFYLKSTQPIHILRILRALRAEEMGLLMTHALERSEVLRRRFRHCATRALMILRTYKGETKSVGKQQLSSQLIISALRELDPNFPILKEARREILEDLMDITHAREIVKQISENELALVERTTSIPSPFAFQMLMQSYTDLLKIEDRIEFIRRLHEMVHKQIAGEKPVGVTLPQVDVTYERLWEEQAAKERLKQEDYEAYLLQLLEKAARKTQLTADQRVYLQRMLQGEKTGYPDSFTSWLETFLAGTIPLHWEDDLVKELRKRVHEL